MELRFDLIAEKPQNDALTIESLVIIFISLSHSPIPSSPILEFRMASERHAHIARDRIGLGTPHCRWDLQLMLEQIRN